MREKDSCMWSRETATMVAGFLIVNTYTIHTIIQIGSVSITYGTYSFIVELLNDVKEKRN